MAKAKTKDKETDDAPEIVKIERGGWEIDKSQVTSVERINNGQVRVTTPGAVYDLLEEEAGPFLDE